MSRLAFFMVFLFTCALWADHTRDTIFIRGDANVDREVDLSDAIGIMNALFIGTSILTCNDAADANDDGKIDLSDALTILIFLFGELESLSYPGTENYGPDLTSDSLGCEYAGKMPTLTWQPKLVKIQEDPNYRYLITENGFRFVFPLAKYHRDVNWKNFDAVFNSWWYPDENIHTISEAELESYPIRGNVTIRPGTYFVKISNQPIVYAIEPNGNLRWGKEKILDILYGRSWWEPRVVTVEDFIFTNYVFGKSLDATLHPEHTLFTYGDGAVYLLENGKKRQVIGEGFYQNYLHPHIVTINPSFAYPSGPAIKGFEPQIAIPKLALESNTGELRIEGITRNSKPTIVLGGSTVTAGIFAVKAYYDDFKIDAVTVELVPPDNGIAGDEDDVEELELWEDGGSEPLGTMKMVDKEVKIVLENPILVAQNSKKIFKLRVRFTSIKPVGSARSGANVLFRLKSLDAAGVSSETRSITVGDNVQFSTFILVRSIPYVKILPFNGSDKITGNVVVELLKFSVTADPAGPVGLTKFTFSLGLTTVELEDTGYYLYVSNNPQSLGELLSAGNNILRTHQEERVGYPLLKVVEARFDVNNDGGSYHEAGTGEHLIIGAGRTNYFTFRATILDHDGITDNESISVSLAGDIDLTCSAPMSAYMIDQFFRHNDFIWSDLNFDHYTTREAPSTLGWFNGFQVPGLDRFFTIPQIITD